MKYYSSCEDETFRISFLLGKELKPGSVVCLYGELGAGKTTFMKGLVLGAADYPSEKISSPTFVYLNIYEGKIPIYHFDLYRLSNFKEFISAGFEEFLYSNGICCIEWAERIKQILPPHIAVTISHVNETDREIDILFAKY